MWTENTVCYNWKFCCKFRHQRVCKAPRPIGIKGLESLRVSTAGGYSFPSAHTQTATTFWVSIMTIFKRDIFI